jgi:hypothetical protein
MTLRFGSLRSPKVILLSLLFALAVVSFAYLVYAGRAGSWWIAPQCKVVESRVIPSQSNSAIYRGEYRVEFEVNGKTYSTWADSGVTGRDKSAVEAKVSNLNIACPVRVRYNPNKPEENVTYPR